MKGDFLGFSFDGIHCSKLGITHVSSSDRYDEDLFFFFFFTKQLKYQIIMVNITMEVRMVLVLLK